ncbi:hypothetical protein MSAN_02103600 [Mycena sanguinolenta]|uniref:Uncharacterized protein n=1 Tax=Mycena sanguinolenta TaxID=230812 RepID=A0A8H7CLW0_9AGAR|nr:hypothetical protein MSAN_02103600 [Mycena sanguinolenta]
MSHPNPKDAHLDPEQCFADRLSSGLYDSVHGQLLQMGNALANLEYIGTRGHDPDFYRGFDWSNNIVMKHGPPNIKEAAEFKFAIFGEIAHPALGTIISAKGNHYEGRGGDDFRPIDDKSKVKDVIVLRAPTSCLTDLQYMFDNQSAILQDIENTEIALHNSAGWNPVFRSCLRSTSVEKPRKDLITIVTQKKYGIPPASAPHSVTPATPVKVQRVKRKVPGEQADSDSETGDPTAQVTGASTSSTSGIVVPAADQIKLGAHYDPRLLPDYSGYPYFQLSKAKLKQLDIRNAQNKLIAPWDNYSELRPGSLILAVVTINIYTFKSDGNDRDRDRKTVQLNAQSIRVLDVSDFPVEKRLPACASRRKCFTFTPRSTAKRTRAEDEDIVMDEDDGGSPSKKHKLTDADFTAADDMDDMDAQGEEEHENTEDTPAKKDKGKGKMVGRSKRGGA